MRISLPKLVGIVFIMVAFGAIFYMATGFLTPKPLDYDGVYQGNDPRFKGMHHSTFVRACLVDGDPCHLIMKNEKNASP